MINLKSRTVNITMGKPTHTMPVVQTFNGLHAALSADKRVVSLQAMQVPVEAWNACPLVAEDLPQHVMAQRALLATKLSEDAVIPKNSSAAVE